MTAAASGSVLTQIVSSKKHKLPIQGQFGETWVADDPILQCEVVLKELPLTNQAEVDKALGEAQRMEKARHRNVAQIRFIGQDGSQPIARIVMPLYQNGCLEQAMRNNGGSIPISRALRYVEHVLLALAHTHARGMLHADIKPSNVLIGDNDEALLTDFGQSVDMLMSGPAAGIAPTPQVYGWIRSPEIFASQPADITADLYQVGLLLYRLINGKRLWKQQLILAAAKANPGMFPDPATDPGAWATNEIDLFFLAQPQLPALTAAGKWPVRDVWSPHVPAGLRRVIRKAISVSPSDRYQSAEEMKNALAGVTVIPAVAGCTVKDDPTGWTWMHRVNEQMYTSSMHYAGNRWGLTSSRQNVTGGPIAKVHAHCGSHGNLKDALKALERRFKEVR